MIFRSLALFAGLIVSATAAIAPAVSGELNESSVAGHFKGYDNGCFEMLDLRSGKVFRYNNKQCARRIEPFSTFKIFNSLVGLETAVLKDANHPMKWDGKLHEIKSWNQDQTLASAFADSVVWYYQNLAEAVGQERMRKYLKEAHYGNEDCSGEIKQFWLRDGALKISADEQVDFLKRFYNEELPFSKRSISIVKEISKLKNTPRGELHGKTGSDGKDGKLTFGWFVGYVVSAGKPYVFACNVERKAGNAWGRKARDISESILSEAGLL